MSAISKSTMSGMTAMVTETRRMRARRFGSRTGPKYLNPKAVIPNK